MSAIVLDYRTCPDCAKPASSPGQIQLRQINGRIHQRPAPSAPPMEADFSDLSVVSCGNSIHAEARG